MKFTVKSSFVKDSHPTIYITHHCNTANDIMHRKKMYNFTFYVTVAGEIMKIYLMELS